MQAVKKSQGFNSDYNTNIHMFCYIPFNYNLAIRTTFESK